MTYCLEITTVTNSASIWSIFQAPNLKLKKRFSISEESVGSSYLLCSIGTELMAGPAQEEEKKVLFFLPVKHT